MKKIVKGLIRSHPKASERYIDVVFEFDQSRRLETSVPIQYRRTGTDIADGEIDTYLETVCREVHPDGWGNWRRDQESFWKEKPSARVTKSFFDPLAKNFEWCCVVCALPSNSNFARRIQDIKEFGYTLSTNTKRLCSNCSRNTTHIILLPLKRGVASGYELWTPAVRAKIMKVLGNFDAYEAKVVRKEGLLPDHKFPEIRWDEQTKRDSLAGLSEVEIRRDFQLLNNQRNQQKREVCRQCYQTGVRGQIYGVNYFYEGNQNWDPSIPIVGKAAEAGCIGCGWYDINKWRAALNQRLKRP